MGTDVDGVYTFDPRQVPDAVLLDSISYEEATELAYFGAKVLHPDTISPISKALIPCIIKNTNSPSGKGTTISDSAKKEPCLIKGVATLDDLVMLSITGSNLSSMSNIASRALSVLSHAEV